MMFQYTHEVIFNSLTMPDGSKRLVRNGGSTGPLTVKRGGEYWKAFIQDQRVYKTPGHVGRYEVLKIDVAKFAAAFPAREDETSFMAAGTYQLSLFVKLLDPHALYEFGYPNYKSFGRHILIGFDVVAGDTAATVAAKVYESLEMAIRKEEMLVGGLDESGDVAVVGEFEENATVVGIRANHYALRFDTVGLALYDETTCNYRMADFWPVCPQCGLQLRVELYDSINAYHCTNGHRYDLNRVYNVKKDLVHKIQRDYKEFANMIDFSNL